MNGQPIMSSKNDDYQSHSWDVTSGYKPIQWRSTVSAPSCALCHKTVYPAEEVNAAGQKFHQLCLKCTTCNTLLNSGNLNEHERKIYCVPCHRRQFGPRGVGRGLGTTTSFNAETPPSSPHLSRAHADSHRYQRKISTGSSPSRTSSDDDSRHATSMPLIFEASVRQSSAFTTRNISANICPRCSKTVYSAEEVKAAGKSFHKRCYSCAHCKGSISGGRYSEHDGELYDNNCYQRLFGPKGITS